MKDIVETVRELVGLNSINPPGQEAAVAGWLDRFFKGHGMEIRFQEVAPGRWNLLARLRGGSGTPILFSGHMDVVPVSRAEEQRWHSDPFQPSIRDGRLYGRGAADMKGGIAAAILAMAEIQRAGIVPPRDILFAATVDEEGDMTGSQALMESGLLPPLQGIVICEPTGLTLCTASRGRTYGNVVLNGATGHGSDLSTGLNAIDLAVEFAQVMKAEVFQSALPPDEGRSFWRVLSIGAGVEPGVVPDECSVGIDARLVLGQEPDGIWRRVDRILQEMKGRHPAMSWSVEVRDRREPWQTPADDRFARKVSGVLAELGLATEPQVFTGTTDGTKLRRNQAPCVIIGPGNLASVHRENEFVDLEEVRIARDFYRAIMLADYQ